MGWLSRLIRWKHVEAQLDAELRNHIERHVADSVARGVSEPEARRLARLELGGVEQVKELCRDVRGTMGTPLLAGRDFTWQDTAGGSNVVACQSGDGPPVFRTRRPDRAPPDAR